MRGSYLAVKLAGKGLLLTGLLRIVLGNIQLVKECINSLPGDRIETYIENYLYSHAPNTIALEVLIRPLKILDNIKIDFLSYLTKFQYSNASSIW